MAFTDRFIKIPVKIYSEKVEELTGNAEKTETWYKINPFDISAYGVSFDDDRPEEIFTGICFKSGKEFTAYMTPDEFEKLLNLHTQNGL